MSKFSILFVTLNAVKKAAKADGVVVSEQDLFHACQPRVAV